MSLRKKAEFESLILRMLKESSVISVRDVAAAAGLSPSDESIRKAIRRTLTSLIKKDILSPKGAGSARVYIAKAPRGTDVQSGEFKDISLSFESQRLLEYLSKPFRARAIVGYNQEFLKSYVPNYSYFLGTTHRAELQARGRVEKSPSAAGTYARNILNRLLIDLSWNSSRLEGNTYSLLETKRLIELGENAVGKDASETQMILNHKNAIEFIVESIDEELISSHQVRSIHALLSENLLGDPSASGRIREVAVGISGTNYQPLENPHLLKECFDLFIEKLNLIKEPFEQSFFSIVQLSYLQAFEDVNKRTARLVANIPLIKNNLKPLSFVDVEPGTYARSMLGVYEKNDISLIRDLYFWAYHRSSQRYTATQQAMGEPNFLRLKQRNLIRDIVQEIILERVGGGDVVSRIRKLIAEQELSEVDKGALFQIIETEILSLHDGNIARFKIRPSEFQEWKRLQ